MKPIPLTPDTAALARRLIWFEEPQEALSDPPRFVAYALARATREEVKILRDIISNDDLREALDKAPPRDHRSPLMGLLECQAGALSPPANANAPVRLIGPICRR